MALLELQEQIDPAVTLISLWYHLKDWFH